MSVPVISASAAVSAQEPPELAGVRQARAEDRQAAQPRPAALSPGSGAIRSAVAEMEQVSLAFNHKLKFHVDHQSHDITVKVIDAETDKVIRILPPEELQRLHSRIRETIGFLFDERV
ncbi:MAG: flagellar protein FlaG [Spirochaetaceae bacterium]|jgi:flagellar protein FlaG|nr:flagellar protein FlaG [Spirochaetaceae bacterium]